jgi:hypothetical protein
MRHVRDPYFFSLGLRLIYKIKRLNRRAVPTRIGNDVLAISGVGESYRYDGPFLWPPRLITGRLSFFGVLPVWQSCPNYRKE